MASTCAPLASVIEQPNPMFNELPMQVFPAARRGCHRFNMLGTEGPLDGRVAIGAK
jgi:hypothetical protein